MSSFATYDLESNLKSEGYKYIIGVDESGRGCGAGTVVAGACYIPEENISGLLYKAADSKKLSAKKREELFTIIRATCKIGIGVISNHVIDDVNILNATKIAMEEALTYFKEIDYVIIDGTVKLENFPFPQQQVIQGDASSISIACASIVAKVVRDRIMLDLHDILPIYGWDTNKGYLTKKHIEALKEYGPCEFHRLSFKKVNYGN